MSDLVADCPRCGARRMTFEVLSAVEVASNGWQSRWEAFCVCGHCNHSTAFVLAVKPDFSDHFATVRALVERKGALNEFFVIEGHVSTGVILAATAPDHLPANVLAAFKEGAKCLSTSCPNAAGTMFRLCVDLASRSRLPVEDVEGLNRKVRRDLGLRLPWLFDTSRLPSDLREISTCIKEDGNDGAHQGTLTETEALDLLDFSVMLLERIYTEPEKLRIAKERREARRVDANSA